MINRKITKKYFFSVEGFLFKQLLSKDRRGAARPSRFLKLYHHITYAALSRNCKKSLFLCCSADICGVKHQEHIMACPRDLLFEMCREQFFISFHILGHSVCVPADCLCKVFLSQYDKGFILFLCKCGDQNSQFTVLFPCCEAFLNGRCCRGERHLTRSLQCWNHCVDSDSIHKSHKKVTAPTKDMVTF